MRRAFTPAITTALAACAFLVPASAQAATCADADVQPSASSLPAMRVATLCLLNNERAAHGLPALRENTLLSTASQAYSKLMVDQQFFAHVTPAGVNLTQRLTSVGYVSDTSAWTIGENLAWGTGGLATPARIHQAWMESPGHRENILEASFREVGVGIVLGSPNSRTAPSAATYTTDFGAIEGSSPSAASAPEPAQPKVKRKRKARSSCASLRRAKARGARISKAGKKKLARCARRAARSRR